MEMELPAIHIMNKFIGNCFKGPSAISQDFCKKKKQIKIQYDKVCKYCSNVYLPYLNATRK